MLFGSKQPATPFHHLLVIVDGTDTSDRAVRLAVALAAATRARVTAIAFVETDTLKRLLTVKVLSQAEMGDFEQGLEESARRQLAAAVATGKAGGVAIETAVVRGNSEETVPREVARRGNDLIVLGAFDSQRANRDLLARQRQQIVDRAPCPVLVAR
ncbi:MAG: universal stress protein [Kiritimatiellae bacterium]|nr:universal stress protein [Kiritimatiellia bacterium]